MWRTKNETLYSILIFVRMWTNRLVTHIHRLD
nr:MAG TPA: hypothetical protein [Caudoviricetes sp.]